MISCDFSGDRFFFGWENFVLALANNFSADSRHSVKGSQALVSFGDIPRYYAVCKTASGVVSLQIPVLDCLSYFC